MLIAYIPLVFAIVGLLLYVLASNPKLVEIGRIVFFASFLALMLIFGRNTLHL